MFGNKFESYFFKILGITLIREGGLLVTIKWIIVPWLYMMLKKCIPLSKNCIAFTCESD